MCVSSGLDFSESYLIIRASSGSGWIAPEERHRCWDGLGRCTCVSLFVLVVVAPVAPLSDVIIGGNAMTVPSRRSTD